MLAKMGTRPFKWLGIINDLRTALDKDPLPLDVVKVHD
jgi:hypothetical protein